MLLSLTCALFITKIWIGPSACSDWSKSHVLCIRNHMISSAIWNKKPRANFSKTNKIVSAICVLWKIYKCLFIPNCKRKIMWLLINNICEKMSRWLRRRNARVSRNQENIAPSIARTIAPSSACVWFENKRFDWPSVSFSDHWPIRMLGCFLFLNWINSFLHCLKKNCIALDESKWRNVFMYIWSEYKT